ncbi:uncharacterized protein MONOS_15758 [Monocercomonoides exilis]|uniref:uncharacterized protein n=2 Tax=Monocercomonoides exilis TaxID=2049356 RepID=UPI003559CC86|nr:hypothetical protein MONOS_15758 [Monocercomonoides exilis]|eukprot:MONOS_15758.1-p1 / transcript=MONOS_15758.1 / gene=MONOS_15758 / organism=Monocercomonoides_exilis_PA203 / gene_product=unspecified product / transcript_product=unspecified product / location=Mono_scaffold01344:3427-3777(-) / protein_length=117 / sequence_SO=supercontig / SO=protein_coding / is_pseudo=false
MLCGSNTSLVADTLLLANTPALPNLLFPRIARGIGTVTSGGSEKDEIEEEREEEDMFDKEAALVQDLKRELCVREEGSVEGDEGLKRYSGVPTRQKRQTIVCGKRKKKEQQISQRL